MNFSQFQGLIMQNPKTLEFLSYRLWKKELYIFYSVKAEKIAVFDKFIF